METDLRHTPTEAEEKLHPHQGVRLIGWPLPLHMLGKPAEWLAVTSHSTAHKCWAQNCWVQYINQTLRNASAAETKRWANRSSGERTTSSSATVTTSRRRGLCSSYILGQPDTNSENISYLILMNATLCIHLLHLAPLLQSEKYGSRGAKINKRIGKFLHLSSINGGKKEKEREIVT